MNDQTIGKLGFGLMRLPQQHGELDTAQVAAMVDAFLAAGQNYFDTAYVYNNGASEEMARVALVARYPRESYVFADKLPVFAVQSQEQMQQLFDTSLARTGLSYFDYYLLHSIGASVLAKMDEMKMWEFMVSLKARGLAKKIGFSFHDTADVLERILAQHPEMEFVQLQINYADWDDPTVQSRQCYEVAQKYGLPVIVMEPVKGGNLAAMGEDIRAILRTHNPAASVASWAIRYAASLPGVLTVLSGMSNMEQLQDNLSTMKDFVPLTAEEHAVLQTVVEQLRAVPTIPCTGCRYCIEDCPQNIKINDILDMMNKATVFGDMNYARGGYARVTNGYGRASSCIACGVCSSRCPQHIVIPDHLQKAAEMFE